jgi:hypothetical protein
MTPITATSAGRPDTHPYTPHAPNGLEVDHDVQPRRAGRVGRRIGARCSPLSTL